MNVLIILLLIFNVTVNAMKISLNNFVYILYVLTKNYVVYVNKSCLSVIMYYDNWLVIVAVHSQLDSSTVWFS